MIVLNSLSDKGAGFGTDTNKVTIYHADGTSIEGSLKSKPEVAADIIDAIVAKLPNPSSTANA
jgi:phosphopantothenoylcysteine decarboxylase/phosphopantothenate--cysteine ligase